jgi:hypothetical protein
VANVFLTLPVPADDGIGAWVDVSSLAPEKTITVDGGAFGGSLYIEGSNDAQASAAPCSIGPFVGGFSVPSTFVQTWNYLRTRRTGSGGVGTPTVGVAGPSAIANVFGAMNVPTGDGNGTPITLSGGGDANTFSVVGTVVGQLLIETSSDGVNFVPSLIFTAGVTAQTQNLTGVLNAARVRVRGSGGAAGPLVAVGSGATAGAAGGGFPGYGGTPPAIGTGAAGTSALVSRSDHTHDGVHTVNGAGGDVTVTAFPGFGGAPPAVGTAAAGTASTASHSDHTHAGTSSVNGATGAATLAVAEDLTLAGVAPALTIGQTLAATWSLPVSSATPNIRWYALDGVNGNDANAGFSDTSAAAAGAVAVQTAAQLNRILPVNGKGRNCVVMIAAGTYAEPASFTTGRSGYNYLIIRATVTNATAGSTAFLDNTADRSQNGNVTATGMNVSGYNPTGTPTNQTIQCLVVGGGAPGFPAQVPISLPGGARLRFDSATATAALRGIKRVVKQTTGTDTLILDATLPAVPVASDVFYLEMPGAIFLSMNVSGFQGANAGNSFVVAGLQTNGTTSGARGIQGDGNYQLCNCWQGNVNAMSIRGGYVGGDMQYTYPDGTTVQTNGCVRTIGSLALGFLQNFGFSGTGPYANSISMSRSGDGEFHGAFVAIAGFTTGKMGFAPTVDADPDGIGTTAAEVGSGYGPCLILGPGVNAGIDLGCPYVINTITITGMGSKPAIQPNFIGGSLYLNGTIAGSTGNSDVGLDLTNASNVTIVVRGSAPTVTGTVGDIRLAGGQITTWANALLGLVDSSGNRFIGPSNDAATIPTTFSGALLGGASAATSSLANAGFVSPVNQPTPFNWPSSNRIALRLRATAPSNTATTTVTLTLYKNGAATAQTVSWAAAGTGAKVDAAHPIFFADGDTYDLRLTNTGADVGAVTPVAAAIEWVS